MSKSTMAYDETALDVVCFRIKLHDKVFYQRMELHESGAFQYGNQTCVVHYGYTDMGPELYDTRYENWPMRKDFKGWVKKFVPKMFPDDAEIDFMKYIRVSHDGEPSEEISCKKAFDIVIGSYRNNDMTSDMMCSPNNIQCMFSDILVGTESGEVLMQGLYNIIPEGYEYDKDGNRK